MALDRMMNVLESKSMFIPNTSIDWDDYFEDMIGVTRPENTELEEVVLHFFGKTGNYIETKPIHGSQKHRRLADQTLEVSLNLLVNYELEHLILSYADSVKVLHPKWLAQKIKDRLKLAATNYNNELVPHAASDESNTAAK